MIFKTSSQRNFIRLSRARISSSVFAPVFEFKCPLIAEQRIVRHIHGIQKHFLGSLQPAKEEAVALGLAWEGSHVRK